MPFYSLIQISLPAFLIMGLLLGGCASKPDPKRPMDETLKSTTDDRAEKVGIKDDKIVIQKKIYLEEQLWKLKSQNEDMDRNIYGAAKDNPGGLWEALKDCRKRVVDPRLGGNGNPDAMEKWEKITQSEEQYEYFVEKNKKHVVGVSEEALEDRIQRLQKDQRLLSNKYDDFKDKLDACENKYKTLLVQHGLNPQDTKAEGEWVDGPDGYKVWRMKKGATKDPEELMNRKKKRESGN